MAVSSLNSAGTARSRRSRRHSMPWPSAMARIRVAPLPGSLPRTRPIAPCSSAHARSARLQCRAHRAHPPPDTAQHRHGVMAQAVQHAVLRAVRRKLRCRGGRSRGAAQIRLVRRRRQLDRGLCALAGRSAETMTRILPLVALMVTIAPAAAERIANPIAIFAGLDKITGLTTTFEAKIGEEKRFGGLFIK